MLLTALLIIVTLALLGVLPVWPHSQGYGYYPASGLGVLAVILLVLLFLGYRF